MTRWKFIPLFLIIFVGGYQILYACHKENSPFNGYIATEGGPGSLEGHRHSSSNGITSSTEYIFAYTSTSTDCDHYVFFLEKELEMIAEAAAKGEGEHLVALARYNGCNESAQKEFNMALQSQYSELFPALSHITVAQFQNNLRKIISSDPRLYHQCHI